MTQAEYARHRGVSRVTVHRAVNSGRIVLANGRIDSEQADRMWSQRTRLRTRTGADGGKVAAPPDVDYFAERARRERAEASIAEAKAAELARSLVPVERVRRELERAASRVREALLQLPDRVAPVLEQRPAGYIRQTLDAEIRSALEALADCNVGR